jgi:hypothetical protein
LKLDGEAEVLIKQQLGDQVFLWRFDAARHELAFFVGDRQVEKASFQPSVASFSLGLRDGLLRLYWNGKATLSHRWGDHAYRGTARPFAISARHGSVRVTDLIIRRDTYVTVDAPLPCPGRWTLGADEYFLLGDNSPVSEDSRHWPFVVKRQHLLGLVVPRNPPSLSVGQDN